MLDIPVSGLNPNKITMTAGDDEVIFFELVDPHGRHVHLSDVEYCVLSLYKKPEDAKPLLEIELADDSQFHFDAEDTAGLKPGIYFYKVVTKLVDGGRQTTVPFSKFIII